VGNAKRLSAGRAEVDVALAPETAAKLTEGNVVEVFLTVRALGQDPGLRS